MYPRRTRGIFLRRFRDRPVCRSGAAERRAAIASAGLEQVTVGIAALTGDGADTGGACAAAAGTGAALRAAAGILRFVLAAAACVLLAAWTGAGLAAGAAVFLPGTLTEVVAAGLELISLQREQGRSGDLQMHARRQDEIGSQREGNVGFIRIPQALKSKSRDGAIPLVWHGISTQYMAKLLLPLTMSGKKPVLSFLVLSVSLKLQVCLPLETVPSKTMVRETCQGPGASARKK